MNVKNKQQKNPQIEVFSQVVATLSKQLLSHIEGNKADYLTSLLQPVNVFVHSACQRDENIISVYGRLDNINRTKVLLEKKVLMNGTLAENLSGRECKENDKAVRAVQLRGADEELPTSDFTASLTETACSAELKEQKSTCIVTDRDDVGVDTKVATTSEQDGGQVVRQKYGSTLGKINQKTEKVVRSVTRSGRKVKQPGYVRNYEKISDSDNSEENLDIEMDVKENKYLISGKKRKKKLARRNGRNNKHFQGSSANKSDVIVSEEADRTDVVENTDMLRTDAGIVLKKRSPAINLTFAKAVGDRQVIRRYYEDKMPFKYFCSLCSYKAKRLSHYEKHMDLHKKNPTMKLYTCEVCNFVAIRKGVLYRHWVAHFDSPQKQTSKHTDGKDSVENDAGKKVIHGQQLSGSGMKVNTQVTVSERFNHLKQNHLTNHTGPGGKPQPYCRHCQIENPDILKSSQDKSASYKGLVFECHLCSYKTLRKLNFVRHQRGVHSNLRPHLCDICGMAFKRSDGLKAHKEVHLDRGLRKLPYPCKQCGKRFKSLAHVKEHSTVHTSTRSFQCDICGQMFKTINVQRRHIMSVHNKANWFRCPFCKKSFGSKYTLKRHLQSHAGENIDGIDISSDPSKLLMHKISKEQNMHTIQSHDEDVDEDVTAIKTITVATENMEELAEQLDSNQISSVGEIGEVYVENIEENSPGTINIVSIKGTGLGKILVPGNGAVTQVLSGVSELQGAYVGSMKLPDFQSTSFSTETAVVDGSKENSNVNIVPSETVRKSYSVSLVNANNSGNLILENQVHPEADGLTFETINADQILGEGQIVNIDENLNGESQIITLGEGQNITEGEIVSIDEGQQSTLGQIISFSGGQSISEGQIISISEGQNISEGQIISLGEGLSVDNEGQIISVGEGQELGERQLIGFGGQVYRLKWDGGQPSLCLEVQTSEPQ